MLNMYPTGIIMYSKSQDLVQLRVFVGTARRKMHHLNSSIINTLHKKLGSILLESREKHTESICLDRR